MWYLRWRTIKIEPTPVAAVFPVDNELWPFIPLNKACGWCGLFSYRWWTSSIKPRLLFTLCKLCFLRTPPFSSVHVRRYHIRKYFWKSHEIVVMMIIVEAIMVLVVWFELRNGKLLRMHGKKQPRVYLSCSFTHAHYAPENCPFPRLIYMGVSSIYNPMTTFAYQQCCASCCNVA